ncbi:DinB family protein [Acinetobacter sp. Marseille-Q1618]|uniref:DinB family protein n=1 Tax=Acinetobacter sp. Marseille-Q1618 TaxID=2697502 RepID=UPI00156F9567|nr:DinB family protein [Acinetobacter sp. Marseille-Q1618]
MNKTTFQLLAQYNLWATQGLVKHLEKMPDDDFHQDVGLFFKSISGTLNHVLLGEHYLWYPRFKEGISPRIALDHTIHTEKYALLNELEQKSKNWIDFIETIQASLFEGNLTYQRTSGQTLTLPYAATLLHVFNHGTHHRGQVSAAMTVLGYACPELDLVYMLAEKNQA